MLRAIGRLLSVAVIVVIAVPCLHFGLLGIPGRADGPFAEQALERGSAQRSWWFSTRGGKLTGKSRQE